MTVTVDSFVEVLSGGPTAASRPSLGRSSAAKMAPLAPINVNAGTTRRAKVSFRFMDPRF
jgi:hypothetical protein